MSNEQILSTVAIFLSIVAIGVAGIGMTGEVAVSNPQVEANVQTLVNQNKEIDSLTDWFEDTSLVDSKQKDQINALGTRIDNLLNEKAELKTKVFELELAVKALAKKPIIIDNTPQKKTFELLTLDNRAIEQEVFLRDQAVYLTGNADNTGRNEITLKIRDYNGQVRADREVGIPDNGRFTVVWVIPTGVLVGEYTATVSDGFIVDTVNFEVR